MEPNQMVIDLFFPKSRKIIEAYCKMAATYEDTKEVLEMDEGDPLSALLAIRAGLLHNPQNPESEGMVKRMKGPYVRTKYLSDKKEEIIAFAKRKRSAAKMPASLYQNLLLAPNLASAKGMYDRAVSNGLAHPYYLPKKQLEHQVIEVQVIPPKRRRVSQPVHAHIRKLKHNFRADEATWEQLRQLQSLSTFGTMVKQLKQEGKIIGKEKFKRQQAEAQAKLEEA